ncbi:hypothetical protein TGRUB_267830 [Toxoplasma gondii RUB]|uniref:Uncharacterized protein n=1 Tax=Toxoplasma gondii RUB TaxID=935652 RepID=A0A086LQQ6_TOXGO|nr:hypothetical protein TGRUB_267830 [Toxoplasma gondii RUB]
MRNFLRLNRTQKTTTWFCVSCSLSPLSSLTAFGVVCLSSLDENSTVFLAGFERLTLRGLSPVARPFLSTFPGAQLRQPLRALTVCKKRPLSLRSPTSLCALRAFFLGTGVRPRRLSCLLFCRAFSSFSPSPRSFSSFFLVVKPNAKERLPRSFSPATVSGQRDRPPRVWRLGVSGEKDKNGKGKKFFVGGFFLHRPFCQWNGGEKRGETHDGEATEKKGETDAERRTAEEFLEPVSR